MPQSHPVSEILRTLDARAPITTAEEWDNVGLLIGDPKWKTTGAVISVDLTEQSLQIAKSKGYKLIVNHHPCIFPKKGLSKIVGGEDQGKNGLVFQAIRHGIAVAAVHTNFDRCALEVVRAVAHGLHVTPLGRLMDKPRGSLVKLAVFVPISHVEVVRRALGAAGAGHIGNYDSCTFGASGEGTFRGGSKSKPFVGRPGQLEKVAEVRLETVIPRGLEKAVLSAVREAHPYEEMAYDLYPIEQGPSAGGLVRGLGYGFWGEFATPRPFSQVVKDVKHTFQVDGFLMTGPVPRASGASPSRKQIRRIAFAAGKGSSFVEAAAAQGCDLFITGEVGYHSALDGLRHKNKMTVMELGHRESERFFLTTMEGWLREAGLRTVSLNVPMQKFC